jgi:hypothetical protein
MKTAPFVPKGNFPSKVNKTIFNAVLLAVEGSII